MPGYCVPAACILFRLSLRARPALFAALSRTPRRPTHIVSSDACRRHLVARGFGRRNHLERSRAPGNAATVAGRDVSKDKLHGLADRVFYAPIDYAFAVRRVLRRIRPSVVVILETEIWPVLYREAKRAGASLVIVNGRISTRALPQYLRWSLFFRQVLEWPDAIFAQSEPDRARYIQLGAAPEKVKVVGNLKYDAAPARRDRKSVV